MDVVSKIAQRPEGGSVVGQRQNWSELWLGLLFLPEELVWERPFPLAHLRVLLGESPPLEPEGQSVVLRPTGLDLPVRLCSHLSEPSHPGGP